MQSNLIYQAYGDNNNSPIVFLHGLFGSPDNWRVVAQLLPEYHCIVLQLPIGFDSDISYKNFTGFEGLVQYIEEVVEKLDLDNFVISGNSLGGSLAVLYALKHPEKISKLVLTGSAGLFERSLSDGRHPKLSKELIRELTEEIFYNKEYCTDTIVDTVFEMLNNRNSLRFLLKVAKATRNCNVKDRLCELNIPTLLIWGKEDIITPPHVAEEFLENIPNAELFYIDECGHSPNLEQPYKFAEIMRKFLLVC